MNTKLGCKTEKLVKIISVKYKKRINKILYFENLLKLIRNILKKEVKKEYGIKEYTKIKTKHTH